MFIDHGRQIKHDVFMAENLEAHNPETFNFLSAISLPTIGAIAHDKITGYNRNLARASQSARPDHFFTIDDIKSMIGKNVTVGHEDLYEKWRQLGMTDVDGKPFESFKVSPIKNKILTPIVDIYDKYMSRLEGLPLVNYVATPFRAIADEIQPSVEKSDPRAGMKSYSFDQSGRAIPYSVNDEAAEIISRGGNQRDVGLAYAKKIEEQANFRFPDLNGKPKFFFDDDARSKLFRYADKLRSDPTDMEARLVLNKAISATSGFSQQASGSAFYFPRNINTGGGIAHVTPGATFDLGGGVRVLAADIVQAAHEGGHADLWGGIANRLGPNASYQLHHVKDRVKSPLAKLIAGSVVSPWAFSDSSKEDADPTKKYLAPLTLSALHTPELIDEGIANVSGYNKLKNVFKDNQDALLAARSRLGKSFGTYLLSAAAPAAAMYAMMGGVGALRSLPGFDYPWDKGETSEKIARLRRELPEKLFGR